MLQRAFQNGFIFIIFYVDTFYLLLSINFRRYRCTSISINVELIQNINNISDIKLSNSNTPTEFSGNKNFLHDYQKDV